MQAQPAGTLQREARQDLPVVRRYFQIHRLAQGSRTRLEIRHQRLAGFRPCGQQHFGFFLSPTERLHGSQTLRSEPALARQDARSGGSDVVGAQRRTAVGRYFKGPFPPVDADQVRAAIGQLFVQRRIGGNVAHGVETVDAVQPILLELLRTQERGQLVRKEDIDVGGQNEPPARPADPDILADHLIQR